MIKIMMNQNQKYLFLICTLSLIMDDQLENGCPFSAYLCSASFLYIVITVCIIHYLVVRQSFLHTPLSIVVSMKMVYLKLTPSLIAQSCP